MTILVTVHLGGRLHWCCPLVIRSPKMHFKIRWKQYHVVLKVLTFCDHRSVQSNPWVVFREDFKFAVDFNSEKVLTCKPVKCSLAGVCICNCCVSCSGSLWEGQGPLLR